MRSILFCFAAAALFITTTTNAEDKVTKKPAAKTVEVKLQDLTLTIPTTWKTAKGSRMRLATYAVPKSEEDADDGDLSISSFRGGGGGVAPNVARWIGQFTGAGRTSKVTKGMAGESEYYFVDITGTYKKPKPGSPPFLQETIPAAGYRMVGTILLLKGKGVYFIKLVGPEKTVKAAVTEFRASFGGDSKTEKEYEL